VNDSTMKAYPIGAAVRLTGGDRRRMVVADAGWLLASRQAIYVLMDRAGRQVTAFHWQLLPATDLVEV
jgi:hypothetical protein